MSRVLVVDDELSLNTLVSDYLRMRGHEVAQCYDGKSALSLLETDLAFDVIILDKRLPDMNGLDVCRKIKATPALAPIPVIFLSASSLASSGEENVGAALQMYKPFSPKDLAQAVERIPKRA